MKAYVQAAALAASVLVAGLAGEPAAADVALNDGTLLPPRGGTPSPVFMAVSVREDGTMQGPPGGAIRARSAERLDTGVYEVIFAKGNLHVACFWTASLARRDSTAATGTGFVTTAARAGTNNGLYVTTFNSTGIAADRPFVVVLYCRN